jgi:endonuclease/exonuclease/phosphatase family metal-dependent hydrolase
VRIFAMLILLASTTAGAAGATNARVMTRNLYIGADVFQAINVPPDQIPDAAGQVLAEIVASDFAARAKVLAQEIAGSQPDAVGLQEVWKVSGVPYGPGSAIQVDFLQLLTEELAARGQKYDVAIANSNLKLTLQLVNFPVAPGVTYPYSGTIEDRDAILVRHNVAWSNAIGGNYATTVPVIFDPPYAELSFEIPRGWTSVDLVFGGNAYRFVNTHLEVESFADGLFQTAQAFELRGILAYLASALGSLPEVVVGDFNSDKDDPPCETALCSYFGVAGYTPYLVMSDPWLSYVNPAYGDALTDVWNLRQNDPRATGVTCCYIALDQDNMAGVNRRVDLLWVRGTATTGVTVQLTGDDTKRRTPSGLLGSDHLGVFGRMTLIPGR